MTPLRFGLLGAGFWARYQLGAWGELSGAKCVAVCDPSPGKAEALAAEFGVPAVYLDPVEMLRREKPDFVDIVTSPSTHGPLVHLAAEHGVAAISQKPLAPTLAEAEQMASACWKAGVPLFVHENWRWQVPIRQATKALRAGLIGEPFRARIDMISGYPVFDNQPYLKDHAQFILADMGVHILDVARFLFGEPRSLYCLTHRVHADIRGEDVATVVLGGCGGGSATVLCQMAYAGNPLEQECFPQTRIFVEGSRGSLELAPDFWLRVTTAEGTHARRHPPPVYAWCNPAYAVVHSSMVDCHRNLLAALQTGVAAETSADDNLKTLRLVFDAYDSAAEGRVISYREKK